jgi:hypothetical protein
MLTIRTQVKQTENKGLGLFTLEQLYEGDTIFEESFLDQTFTQEQMDKLPNVAQKFLKEYCVFNGHVYHLDFDNCRHMNHSRKNANVKFIGDRGVAIRDIKIGEELLTDYAEIDKPFSQGKHGFDIVE